MRLNESSSDQTQSSDGECDISAEILPLGKVSTRVTTILSDVISVPENTSSDVPGRPLVSYPLSDDSLDVSCTQDADNEVEEEPSLVPLVDARQPSDNSSFSFGRWYQGVEVDRGVTGQQTPEQQPVLASKPRTSPFFMTVHNASLKNKTLPRPLNFGKRCLYFT